MATRQHLYVIITPQKVHLYGSHARALSVFTEAERRGAKRLEFTDAALKTGATKRQRALASKALAADHAKGWGLTACGEVA